MIASMTAFASVQTEVEFGVFSWEIKSVNHRYLDVSFRLPESLRFLEPGLRQLLCQQVARGKLECQLKFNGMGTVSQPVSIDTPLVQSLLEAGKHLALEYQLADDLTVSHLLSWPGVVQLSSPNLGAFSEQIEQSFQAALVALIETRLKEGSALKDPMQERLHRLKQETQWIAQHGVAGADQIREKLLSRLEKLTLEVSDQRIGQEIALILTRLDVTEELDRLNAHIQEVERVLAQGGVVGRRLDFLMQELNREANTLSSKSDSSELTGHAVEMKVLIEQMREQVQNIE